MREKVQYILVISRVVISFLDGIDGIQKTTLMSTNVMMTWIPYSQRVQK